MIFQQINKKYALCLAIIIANVLLFQFSLFSMQRDYFYRGFPVIDDQQPDHIDKNGEEQYIYESNELCKSCFRMLGRYKQEVDVSAIPNLSAEHTHNWPKTKDCHYCHLGPVFYSGYLHFLHNDEFPFLNRQINYSKKYPTYQSYWPETSSKAEKINDYAIKSLEILFTITELNQVWTVRSLFEDYITTSLEIDYYDYRKSYAYKSLVSSAFRFSDYYIIFENLIRYSKRSFCCTETERIQDMLNVILDDLAKLFMEIYEESERLHPTEEIMQEMRFIDLLYEIGHLNFRKELHGQSSYNEDNQNKKFYFDMQASVSTELQDIELEYLQSQLLGKGNSDQPEWFLVEYLTLNGTMFNDLHLHKKALDCLNEVVLINPYNIDALIERAHAHFELNDIELAIKDYKIINALKNKVSILNNFPLRFNYCHDAKTTNYGFFDRSEDNYIFPKGNTEYSIGICAGIIEGGSVSIIEFLPSTYSCCRGLLHGLWGFVCSPINVSSELIDSSYALMIYLKNNTSMETLEAVVPEIKILCENWDNLSDHERGKQIGFIIGKYGVDILAPGTAIAGVKKFRQLTRANTMLTLNCCVESQIMRVGILQQSTKHVAARELVTEAVRNGLLIPRNANVVPHVMQKNHAWDKIAKLTGNQKEDFITIKKILEDNKILNKEFLKDSFGVPRNVPLSPLKQLRYEKQINGEIIECIFIKNIETEEIHLIDAWVKTK
jgi:hypothetical protein